MEFRDISTGSFVGLNVLNFWNGTTSVWNANTLSNLNNVVATLWNEELKATVASTVQLFRVYSRDITVPNGEYAEYLTTVAGSASGDRVPANVTLALALRTAFTGRNYRGRIFLCGMPLSAVVEDAITNAYRTLLIESWENWHDALPAGITHVLLSRVFDGIRPTNAVRTPITTYTVADQRIDTRRLRLRRR